MNWEEIKRGWLTISDSIKREMKARGQETKGGRTPLGDKGLGRLGSQRLGRNIELWTSKGDIEYYIGINWRDFEDKPLSKVPVIIEEKSGNKKTGTRIVISGLRSIDIWEYKNSALSNKISQLLFPFGSKHSFDVALTINDKRVDLEQISASLLEIADLIAAVDFDGDKILYNIDYRLSFFQSQKTDVNKEQYQKLVSQDGGTALFSFLTEKKSSTSKNDDGSLLKALSWKDSPGWFATLKLELKLSELGGVHTFEEKTKNEYQRKEIANPGSFSGVIYSFNRERNDINSISSVFDNISEYRGFLSRHAGIRVFRDGFGIRPFGQEGDDWLKLGHEWTSGASWYGLRPKNVIGYVNISAKCNEKLIEATDREGFVENPFSLNFYLIMQTLVSNINRINELFRRGYLQYLKASAERELGVTSASTEKVFEAMRETALKSEHAQEQVAISREKLEKITSQVETITEQINFTPLFATETQREAEPLLQKIIETLQESDQVLKEVDRILTETKKLGQIANMLEPEIAHLHDEIQQFSELAGLGITAEALTHEINIAIDGLSAKTTNVVNRLREAKSLSPQIISFTEYIQSTIGELRKQLSHLDPSLRYVREKSEIISINEFTKDIELYYTPRLRRKSISFIIELSNSDFKIKMSRGKLTQVFDNLILNSEYWLNESIRKNELKKAFIKVQIASPFVNISDSGPGVSQSVENYIFQPFVTTKPKEIGRGLGLFITRQLLDSSNCFISLLPHRNSQGNRYIFRIDFSGAQYEK
jgi:signal transduction histidine kinase